MENHELAGQAAKVLSCSLFVADISRRRPELLLALLDSGDLNRSFSEDYWEASLADALAVSDEDAAVVLRQFRQRHMVRIIWRDFCRSADTLETIRDTSRLADACIRRGLAVCREQLHQKHGQTL